MPLSVVSSASSFVIKSIFSCFDKLLGISVKTKSPISPSRNFLAATIKGLLDKLAEAYAILYDALFFFYSASIEAKYHSFT